MTEVYIEDLTPEQEAKLPEYRDKWTEIGLRTGPVDFEKAKEAVCLAYKLADLKEPTQFFVAKSPLDAIRVIKELDPTKDDRTIFNEMSYGCHDASWLSFYEFFRDEVGVEECNKLNGLIELAKHCGWLSMYEDVVVFQDRPCSVHFDDQERLHSETDPAIEYSDGCAIYVWHGTRIPDEWITDKDSMKASDILKWENLEQRRCGCEIMGWHNILDELNAKVIDKDDDPQIGTLVEVNIPDIGKERFIRVLCGTGREFALPVPPDSKTALEANAWTYGVDPWVYKKLEVRT